MIHGKVYCIATLFSLGFYIKLVYVLKGSPIINGVGTKRHYCDHFQIVKPKTKKSIKAKNVISQGIYCEMHY